MLGTHPFEIRERRWRLQQQLAEAQEDAGKQALEAQIAAIQEDCPHAYPEENPEKGWRCRDCDLRRPPPPEPEAESEPAGAAGA